MNTTLAGRSFSSILWLIALFVVIVVTCGCGRGDASTPSAQQKKFRGKTTAQWLQARKDRRQLEQEDSDGAFMLRLALRKADQFIGADPAAIDDLLKALTDSETAYLAGEILKKFNAANKPDVDSLRDGLEHASPLVKRWSVKLLALHGSAAAEFIPLLEPLLSDRDRPLVNEAINTLVAIGKPAVPALTRAAENHPAIRDKAIDALSQLGSGASQALPNLCRQLPDSTGKQHAQLVQAIAKAGRDSPLAGQTLTKDLLDRTDDSEVASVQRALAAIGPVAVDELLKSWPNRPDEQQDRIVRALIGLGHTARKAIPVLLDRLAALDQAANSRDSITRRRLLYAAVVTIGLDNVNLSATQLVQLAGHLPALMMQSLDETKRAKALAIVVTLLGKAEPKAVAAAGPPLAHLHERVKQRIAIISKQMNRSSRTTIKIFKRGKFDRKASEGQTRSIRDTRREREQLSLLKELTQKIPVVLARIDPTNLLSLQIRSGNEKARDRAVEQLRQLPAARSVPILSGLLKERDAQLRHLAAETLAEIGAPAKLAVNDLIEVYRQDKDKVVRQWAGIALSQLGRDAAAAVPLMLSRARSSNEETYGPAQKALKRLGAVAVEEIV